MGYGLLFFGYILAFFFSSGTTYFFADVIGSCIMIAALYKLSAYDKGYFMSLVTAFVYAVVCFVGGMVFALGFGDSSGVLTPALSVLKLVSVVVFHAFMLAATARMCVRAELPKYTVAARRNFIMTIVYCALDAVVVTVGESLGKARPYLAIAAAFLGIIWLVANAYLIFRCFSLICEDGDENAEPKKSKIPLVNKIMEKIDRLGDKLEPKTDDTEDKRRKHKRK